MSKDERGWNSSLKEKPVRSRPRRLVDWINLTGAKKVHLLIDNVYKRRNLEMAWEKVKANRGRGGIDGQSLEAFEAQLEQQLDRLQRELKEDTYQPLPVRQHPIPKRDIRRRRGSFTSARASSSSATKSSAGRGSSICLRVRFVVRPDRVRCMRILRRSRSVVSWTRSDSEPNGGYL
jgi:hypothetical protein